MSNPGEVTQLLQHLQAGDETAMEKLAPLVYSELRRIAAGFLRRERSDHTLQPTALVHEAYLKLAAESGLSLESKSHFLGIAARAMRQILVDHSRRHKAQKRGGGMKIELDENTPASAGDLPEILSLDTALNQLAELDPRKSEVIELKYFGGMTTEEISAHLGISTATVTRDLRMAQSWIRRSMRGEAAAGEAP